MMNVNEDSNMAGVQPVKRTRHEDKVIIKWYRYYMKMVEGNMKKRKTYKQFPLHSYQDVKCPTWVGRKTHIIVKYHKSNKINGFFT
jgi:hypothetical protein